MDGGDAQRQYWQHKWPEMDNQSHISSSQHLARKNDDDDNDDNNDNIDDIDLKWTINHNFLPPQKRKIFERAPKRFFKAEKGEIFEKSVPEIFLFFLA